MPADTDAALAGGLDVASPEAISDPAGYFARVRELGGPVQWSERHRGWVVLSHAEVAEAFRDSERLSADRLGPLERAAASQPAAFGQVVELLRGWMIFRDPPAHTRLRDPVRSTFTPRKVEGLEPLIEEVVDGVLADLDGGDVVSYTEQFARPLPALVIAAVLGVDPSERHRFQAWSDDLATMVFSASPSRTPGEASTRAAAEFGAYFGQLLERERREPSGSLLSAMIEVVDRYEGPERLTEMELVGACTLLLFAGHETTTSLLANTMGVLLERPDVLAWWQERPEVDPTAVEEFTRVVGPARTMVRKVAEPHERGGQLLQPGENVFLCIAAANHDEGVFDQPGRLDLERHPNPHLGFGWGLHHCVGANLARLEARVALRKLFERYATIEAAGTVPQLTGNVLGFGRDELLVRLR